MAALWVLCAPASTFSQSQDIEYQARILAHAQLVPKNRSIGFAGWAVLPNITTTKPFRGLLLAGLMHRTEKRWIEFMAGGVLSNDERNSFVIDVRMVDRSIQKVSVFVELDYRPREKKLFVMPNAVTSFRIRRIAFNLGAEADIGMTPGDDVFIMGPRLGFALPLCRRICKSAALTTSFRFATNGKKVIRQYMVFNL